MGVCSVHHCAECGGVAGTMELKSTDGKPSLVIGGFNGMETIFGSFESIRKAIETSDLGTIHDFGSRYVPFYCPECDLCYCWEHWAKRTKVDADFDDWFDCTYGECPRGHRRLIED